MLILTLISDRIPFVLLLSHCPWASIRLPRSRVTRDGHLQQRFKYPYILVPTQLSGYHKAKETKKNVQLTAPDIVTFSGQMQVAVSSPRSAQPQLFSFAHSPTGSRCRTKPKRRGEFSATFFPHLITLVAVQVHNVYVVSASYYVRLRCALHGTASRRGGVSAVPVTRSGQVRSATREADIDIHLNIHHRVAATRPGEVSLLPLKQSGGNGKVQGRRDARLDWCALGCLPLHGKQI